MLLSQDKCKVAGYKGEGDIDKVGLKEGSTSLYFFVA